MNFEEFKTLGLIDPAASHAEIAHIFDASKQTIYNYVEKGIPTDKVEKLAKKLGKELKISIASESGRAADDYIFAEVLSPFAILLMRERKLCGMSLEDVAKKTGVSMIVLKLIERGAWNGIGEIYLYVLAINHNIVVALQNQIVKK